MPLPTTTGTIYEKTIEGGTDKLLVMPGRSRFVAQLNIPNWRHIRMAIALSCTTTDNLNAGFGLGLPAQSTQTGNARTGMGIGLLKYGDLDLDHATQRGYFMGSSFNSCNVVVSSGACLVRAGAGGTASIAGAVLNEGNVHSIFKHTSTEYLGFIGQSSVTSETTNACISTWEIERNGTTTRIAGTHFTSSTLNATSSRFQTGTTVARLEELMVNRSYVNVDTPFSDQYHEDPTPFLIFQHPFVSWRMRIHSWRVEVMEPL